MALTNNKFIKGILNQNELSFGDLYNTRNFTKISDESEMAGKQNSHILEYPVFDTIQMGVEIVSDLGYDVFKGVGDCDEKPKW